MTAYILTEEGNCMVVMRPIEVEGQGPRRSIEKGGYVGRLAHRTTFGCWVVRLFSFAFREREISPDRGLGEA